MSEPCDVMRVGKLYILANIISHLTIVVIHAQINLANCTDICKNIILIKKKIMTFNNLNFVNFKLTD